jgi:hypothetical protein
MIILIASLLFGVEYKLQGSLLLENAIFSKFGVNNTVLEGMGYGIGISSLYGKGKLVFEPGVRFVQKYDLDRSGRTPLLEQHYIEYNYTNSYDYVELYGKFKFRLGGFEPYIGGGVSYLMSAYTRYEFPGRDNVYSDRKGAMRSTEKMTYYDASVLGGLDYTFLKSYVVGVEYSQGFVNVYNEIGDLTFTSIILNLGYKF